MYVCMYVCIGDVIIGGKSCVIFKGEDFLTWDLHPRKSEMRILIKVKNRNFDESNKSI